jgi:hypothetical protein
MLSIHPAFSMTGRGAPRSLLRSAFLLGPFGPLLDHLCACYFIPMNPQSQVGLKRCRPMRDRAELCATRPANPVRFRSSRPRTMLVQFVSHPPEVLPVRVISLR